MLEIKGVSKTFQLQDQSLKAVDDVSFSVQPGEIYGIIGQSGAGKSTLLRCINVLERPDKGEIFIDGQDVLRVGESELLEKRKEIGMIFQGFHLLMQKDALHNVLLPAMIHHQDAKKAKEKARELLALVGLEDKMHAYPKTLSGGQKQRLAIARALVTSPRYLLSDEATSALDPQTTESILNLLKKIGKEYSLSIVMITHQMEVAKEICNRVAIMEKGKFVEEGTVEEIFLRPREKETRALIRSVQKKENVISSGGPVYRLGFAHKTANRPIIAETIRKFNVDINILAGDIHSVQEEQIGNLTVEIWGKESDIANALAYLNENQVRWEVVA